MPIEIKSGKDYTKHAALSNAMANAQYDISNAYVFHNENISTNENITYYPIYMLMFVKKSSFEQDMVYKLDLDILK